jgi:hypothetical protein
MIGSWRQRYDHYLAILTDFSADFLKNQLNFA